MKGWLSSTWEPSWRSFQYFNIYRLIMAGLLLLAVFFPQQLAVRVNLPPPLLDALAVGYLAATLSSLLLSSWWQFHFNIQLSLQMLVDIAVATIIMLGLGGVRGIGSDPGVLLLVSLAAAGLVGQGRLVLFYAALATLAVLAAQYFGILFLDFEQSTVVQAGFLGAGFFATAILGRLLGQRAMINEDLARRRGVALDNQIRISRRIVERMQDGVLIVGVDGRIVRYNPVAQAMLDLSGPDAPLPPALAAAFADWAAGGAAAVQFGGVGGRRLLARFDHTASTDREMLVFLEDLSRVQERAQQMKLASLGRLTASIAHEIRNPLSAISHAGELLHEERRSEMQDRLLRILNDNVRRLDRIVQDVLMLGRRDNVQPETLALDEFCAAFVRQFAAAEGLAPEVIVWRAGSGAALRFDRTHLHQVLWNIVSNALRHSSRGPGAVRLEALATADGGRIELHVFDDGAGVPDEVRQQIFEPFFTTHSLGTGLGLYISRELCAANGASLAVGPDAPGGHFIIAGRSDTCLPTEANANHATNESGFSSWTTRRISAN